MILLSIGVAVYVGIIAGVVTAAGPPGSPGYLAVLIGETVFSLITAVFSFQHLWQLGVSGHALRGRPQARRAGVSASFLVFKAGILGAVLLAASVLLTAGFALGALAIWLTPVPPTEQYARRVLAEELRLRRTGRTSLGTTITSAEHGDGGILAGLLVLASLVTSGIALAAFALSLAPAQPTEQCARRVLAEKLRLHRDRQQFIHQHSGHHHRKR